MNRSFSSFFAALTWVAMALSFGVLTGCHSSGSPAAAGASQELGIAWKLTLKSECTTSIDKCLAGYGFTVLSNGTYVIGPAAGDDDPETGYLDVDHFRALQDLVASVKSDIHAVSDQTCGASTRITSKDTVTLEIGASSDDIVKAADNQICYRISDIHDAIALHKAIRDMASKHYSIPYPSQCVQANKALEKTFNTVRGCQTDADCTYVNIANFDPISTGEQNKVVTDDCEAVHVLAVANRDSISNPTNLATLLRARRDTRRACENQVRLDTCMETKGFQSLYAPAPVCVQNVCQINPTIRILGFY
jgi:hypothetical protein